MGSVTSCECLADDKRNEYQVQCVPCTSDVADWPNLISVDKVPEERHVVPVTESWPSDEAARDEVFIEGLPANAGREEFVKLPEAPALAADGAVERGEGVMHEVPEDAPLVDMPTMPPQPTQNVQFQDVQFLNGDWRNESDNAVMGIVNNGFMTWDEAFNHSVTHITMRSASTVEMTLFGELHQGSIELGPPVRLRWDDGDVWRLMAPHGEAVAPPGEER